LQRPDLVDAVLEDVERLGYVGEERPKLLAYLIGVSRKLDRPLSGIVLSQSGAGKSTLTDAVESLTPPEDVVLFSRLSAQALGYMPRDYLKQRLVILEERVGGEAADYSIRVLQSRHRFCSAVVMKDPKTGRMATRRVEVEGPIAYMETTTNPALNHENATRCFELGLDESEEQTRRIHARQRASRTLAGVEQKEQSEEVRRRHHNAQRLLEPVRVIIPYVEQLSFPSRWLRTRRDHERFLCLIEAVAFLHQHQRAGGVQSVGERTFRWIEATVADYRRAYELAQDVLGATLHELSRDARSSGRRPASWSSSAWSASSARTSGARLSRGASCATASAGTTSGCGRRCRSWWTWSTWRRWRARRDGPTSIGCWPARRAPARLRR